MSVLLENEIKRAIISLVEPPPDERASDWCVRPLPDGRSPLWIPPGPASAPGPFSFAGREYSRMIVDFFSDPQLADLVACFGSQLGKTVALEAGLLAKLVREAIAAVWAMPTRNLARSFSKTRWMPFVEASAAAKDYIPKGARRHDWASLEQRLGASLLNFVWSNSPAELSSRPAEVAVADEIDKFSEGTDAEADAVNLLEQRTKDFPNPKRAKTSTPTIAEGPIWQEFLKGDQCRRFGPCPSCKKLVTLAWSKTFTVFKITGCEAFVFWDKEARLPRGRGYQGTGWDLDRVIASARYQCPHCGGHILDGHKTQMDRDGVWEPTRTNAPAAFKSLHLPSMWGSSPETRVGRLAQKFLEGKHSLQGLRGFINGELAEPDDGQTISVERFEIISAKDAAPLDKKTTRFIAADFQDKEPRVPWVCREFAPGGHSRLVGFGWCENFDELRLKQIELNVSDDHVGIDSGNEASTVYAECLRWGKAVQRRDKIEWVGWTPMKGRDKNAKWIDSKTGLKNLFGIVNAPGANTRYFLPLLEFNGPSLKDILERLRRRQTEVRWELTEDADENYFKHLDGETRVAKFDPKTKRVVNEWQPRSRTWPIDLRDCEIMIQALAMWFGVLSIGPKAESK